MESPVNPGLFMFTKTYIEALLVDESSADRVWEAWDRGEISTYCAWWLIAGNANGSDRS